MKPNLIPQRFLGLLAATFLFQISGLAYVLGPYSPDASTLHLWHMDESAIPVVDTGSNPIALTNLANGATLANASFTGFGTALSTFDGGQTATTLDGKDAVLSPRPLVNGTGDSINMSYAGADGAFTMEAIIRVDFDPTLNLGPTGSGGNGRVDQMQIISGDNEDNGNRIFQFRIDPVGTTSGNTAPQLHFINLHGAVSVQDVIFEIPTTGPNAIVSNQWYHVAVTYDGNENTVDNIKLYWTRLDQDPSPMEANLIGSSSLQFDLTTGSPDFCIGNEGRSTGGASGNFVGLIDEVRLSSVARPGNAMQLIDPNPAVLTEPASQIVAVGQPVSFEGAGVGALPLSYEWLHGGTPISGATQNVYSIAAAQPGDAGEYQVVITNSFGAVTSSVATLSVRTPVNLTWVGFLDWDTNNINWDANADTIPDSAYTEGDNVLFDGQGSTYVSVPQQLHPSSVVVDSVIDYTFATVSGGGFEKNTSLRKSGTGMLTLDTANSYSGPTVIAAGTLQVGAGSASGSLGTGPVTNNAALIMDSTAGATIDVIAGTGALTNNAGTTVLNGTNLLSGPLTINAGSVRINGPDAKGNHTSIILNATPNPFTGLTVAGGVTFGSGVTLSLLGTTASPDTRCAVAFTSGTNVFDGSIVLGGDGAINVSGPAGGELDLNGPITADAVYGFGGKLILRGSGTNQVNGQIQIGGHVSFTDSALWIINSTGNAWTNTDIAGANSILQLGADNALPPSISLNVYNGKLDLAGHNQQVAYLQSFSTTSPFPLTAAGVITNSSTTADSVLTLNSPADCIFTGTIKDGPRKVGLTLAAGSLTLTNINTYSGDTIINAGFVALTNNGSIGNSANLVLASGTALVVTNRLGGTLTLNSGQTLRGNGAFNVIGNLANNGTIELKLNKAGAVLSNDSIQGLAQITYGGTLKLDVSGDALTTSDSFKLFYASTYVGAFAAFDPPIPATGLSWDTSTLATDGTLRIKTGPATNPIDITSAVISGGTELELSWPADHQGWRLEAQTNSVNVGLSTNWSGVTGSDSTNRVLIPIDPANGSVFYRLVYP